MNYKERYKSLKEELSKMEDKTSNLALLLTDSMHDLEKLHPELKESEDERIRKDIISYLKSSTAVSPKTWIEWLEKQGEQKSTDKVALMPTWSKEDERDFDVIYGIIYNSCNAEDASRLIEWLKSLKDSVQPQQEWSEEDESMLTRCIGALGKCYMGQLPTTVVDEIEWLRTKFKSLRPHSQWKPSDEQLDSLYDVLNPCDGFNREVLESLYIQLKKLREEDV